MGGNAAEVTRAGDEAVERLRAVSNHSMLVLALERYAEALSTIGEPERAARCLAERATLLADHGLRDVSWRPPASAASSDAMPSLLDAAPFADVYGDGIATVSMSQSLASIEGYVPTHIREPELET